MLTALLLGACIYQLTVWFAPLCHPAIQERELGLRRARSLAADFGMNFVQDGGRLKRVTLDRYQALSTTICAARPRGRHVQGTTIKARRLDLLKAFGTYLAWTPEKHL
jgi:hypothetical protein